MDFGIYAADVNKTIYVRLRDSTTGLAKTGLAFGSAGAVCSYVLPGAARAAITLATQTVTGGHSDGGFVEVDATNCKGLYRLDLTDAAIASGDYTLISIEFDGIIEESMSIPLHIRNVNTVQISDDATAAVNAEAFFDGTGYAGTNNVIPTVTTLTGHTNQTADHTANIAKIPLSDGVVTWNATALGSINTQADTALTDYAGPTKAEMDTAHGLLATEAKQDIIDTNVDDIEAAVITNAVGVDVSADILTAQNDLDILTGADGANLLSGTQASIDAIEADVTGNTVASGTSDSGSTTTLVDAVRTEATTDHWADKLLVFGAGGSALNVGHCALITGFTPASDTITFAPAALASVTTETYEIRPWTLVNLLPATQTSIDTIETDTTTDIPAQITGLNDVAATDIVSAGAITTLTGSVASVDLVDTLTTYTGNTVQTADHTAGIADIPTVAEFEVRTPTAAQLAYIADNAATGLPVTFTTSGGSTTVAVLNQVDGGAGSATDDQYNGRLLVFTDGTLAGVVTDITNYTGSSTTATITAIPTAPTASHNARLI